MDTGGHTADDQAAVLHLGEGDGVVVEEGDGIGGLAGVVAVEDEARQIAEDAEDGEAARDDQLAGRVRISSPFS